EHIREDCPICFLPLPTSGNNTYKSCCGKVICDGCMHGMIVVDVNSSGMVKMGGNCPFCRAPHVSGEEEIERLKARMKVNDALAHSTLGYAYHFGDNGLPRDQKMAISLLLKAAKLGDTCANFCLGKAYDEGDGVEKDETKAKHHWELAAMGGNVDARHSLGIMEINAGRSNRDQRLIARSFKHFAIAARAGLESSLDYIKEGFIKGHITKDEYTAILRAYQKNKEEMKSDTRERSERVVQLCSKLGEEQDEQERRAISEQCAQLMGLRLKARRGNEASP
ncbi:hypothetical protein ACHAWF_000915, partial [Thalassiosira exigua]